LTVHVAWRTVAEAMRSLPALAVVVSILALAGCGDDPEAKPAAPKAAAPPPDELLGTYATTLRPADVPADASPELADQDAWLVKITATGGVDCGPALAIVRPPSDTLEISKPSVAGDTLTLKDEECAPSEPGGTETLVTSAYRWKLDGRVLRLTMGKGGCPDKVAETILTSEPWKQLS
jgi:hypothetical protein